MRSLTKGISGVIYKAPSQPGGRFVIVPRYRLRIYSSAISFSRG